MIVNVDEWVFDVDIAATMEYSAQEAEQHCTCDFCRNFYKAVDRFYPNLRHFLAQFGLDITAPDRMSPMDYSESRIDYDPEYYVFGRILTPGRFEMAADTANICVSDWKGQIEGKDAFALNVYELMLPWVLEEPFAGGIQQQNKTSWFGRLLRRNNQS